ncbi:SGNH/GDSL hydrolase family protein [Aeromonas hydrophila]|uniref:SGNH/GDSL hydrolase family protein n=1 Tax=Aeromonas hydrophila TaxID=644 RepID=UPI00207D7046|nr:SGNH/GDSL hydrolase family protein [Aeromonas hydrophila]MCO4211791.1 SGNH/GDSL hydrolase family protein [Aeromonas hydrophila]HDX8442188.1 SGNH/GDSL hydrolase family protein [Aeromonas hydrophila]HDX8632980.1 SGNH/GDSL hydrolase family protein [Aeromonas hydrophila]
MKILFIGFSVTEEKDGYISYIRDFYKNKNVSIDVRAIGGATFQVIPYLIDDFVTSKYDFVIYEIATCYRFINTMISYEQLLQEISHATLSKGALPCYINMYRKGIDYNEDIQATSIEYHAKINKYPFLNLINEIKNIQDEEEYLRDGIHTNSKGAVLYSNRICQFIDTVLRTESKSKKKLSYLAELLPHEPKKLFTRGEFTTAYISIEQGRTLSIIFPFEVTVCGILFIQGSDSGTLKVEFPETGFTRNIHMYDEFCYYRRYSYQFFPEQKSSIVHLYQSDVIPQIELKKGEYNNNPRAGDIVGLLIKESSNQCL